jgi:hypothetical protein
MDKQVPVAAAAPETIETQPAAAKRIGPLPYLLALPAFIPLIVSIVSAKWHGLIPTGFVQVDMACYVANARQHFVNGFHLTYSNPYAPYGSPAIYFEPHIFLLGLLQWIGFGPGLALNLFGAGAAAFAAIVAAKLYSHVVGWQTLADKIGFVVFFWGGGVLALAGLIFGLPAGYPLARSFVLFDPNEGWWMFNFGRNLVYPTEAFYHGVFLLAILMLLRERIGWTLALSALLSITHPYAGLSLALVLAAFAFIEMITGGGRDYAKLLGGAITITVLHLGYYLLFLNRFPDHRAVQAQWGEKEWVYIAWTFGPALYLVGFLTFARFARWARARELLKERKNRLFLIWFAVIFALTQHDLVMKSMQPIHFARGYDWIALFFLASPAIIALIEKGLALQRPVARLAAVGLLLAIFLFDNFTWFLSFRDPSVQHYAIALTPGERETLDWLHDHASAPSIVVAQDRSINYLTATYTSVRAWYGHDINTPDAKQRIKEAGAVFRESRPVDAADVYYIPRRDSQWSPPPGAREVHGNAEFVVWASR